MNHFMVIIIQAYEAYVTIPLQISAAKLVTIPKKIHQFARILVVGPHFLRNCNILPISDHDIQRISILGRFECVVSLVRD